MLDSIDFANYKRAKRNLELAIDYRYGERDFVLISNESDDANDKITGRTPSVKIMCLQANGIDGKIEPYRMYEIRDLHDDEERNKLTDILMNLEKDGTTDDSVNDVFRNCRKYDGQVNFIKYNGEGKQYYNFGKTGWRKTNTYTPITPKARYNGGGFTQTYQEYEQGRKLNSQYSQDIENFNKREYNQIKLPAKEYFAVNSAIMQKYLNNTTPHFSLKTTVYGDKIYTYYYDVNDNPIIVSIADFVDVERNDYEFNENAKELFESLKNDGLGYRSSEYSNQLFEDNRTANRNDKLAYGLLREQDSSYQRRYTQNDSNSYRYKEVQFEIIQNSNPMLDDIHTGIRSVDEIKTFEEAIEEYKDGVTLDFIKYMIDKAIKNNSVRQRFIYTNY